MADYKINLDRKVLKLLGSQLYGDVPSVIAELVANSYDAFAENVWITLDTIGNIITIEDDGNGMTDQEINTRFLNIGYDKRDVNSQVDSKRKIMGRKGIGKLAVFSLTNYVKVLSCKDGKKAGCLLDFEKITSNNDEQPDEIQEDRIKFRSDRLSNNGSGTRLELIEIKKRITTSYRFIVNRLIRMFDVNDQEFSIHIRKNDAEFMVLRRSELNYFSIMDTIVTIGDEFNNKKEAVMANNVSNELKFAYTYPEFLQSRKNSKLSMFPYKIKVENKNGEIIEVDFEIKGWIGTVDTLTHLKELGNDLTQSEESDEDKITISDNRISLFSRNKLGEYDVLPKIKANTNYEAYVIGELFVDIFEDDSLVDMAISNRRGYDEQDSRYIEVIKIVKKLLTFIVGRKDEISRRDKKMRNIEEIQKYKMDFFDSKPQTQKILVNKLRPEEIKIIVDESYQFSRIVTMTENTKKVLISHSRKYKLYGDFVVSIFENLGIDVASTFIYTSDDRMTAPYDIDVFDYLKECFREDIYVIYILSKYFFDSSPCILETGAAWATNKHFSNLIVDIEEVDIEKPIHQPDLSLNIGDINKINISGMIDFIKIVLKSIEYKMLEDDVIEVAINKAIREYSTRINEVPKYYPLRKYQAHPICDEKDCMNPMELDYNQNGNVVYKCKDTSCSCYKEVSIY